VYVPRTACSLKQCLCMNIRTAIHPNTCYADCMPILLNANRGRVVCTVEVPSSPQIILLSGKLGASNINKQEDRPHFGDGARGIRKLMRKNFRLRFEDGMTSTTQGNNDPEPTENTLNRNICSSQTKASNFNLRKLPYVNIPCDHLCCVCSAYPSIHIHRPKSNPIHLPITPTVQKQKRPYPKPNPRSSPAKTDSTPYPYHILLQIVRSLSSSFIIAGT
jgi:hypothetical protein